MASLMLLNCMLSNDTGDFFMYMIVIFIKNQFLVLIVNIYFY